MGVDCFAKFDKILGPVSHEGTAGWMEIMSFRLKEGAGRELEIELVKPMDRTSPTLLRACANGDPIATVIVHLCRKGESVTYTLRDVIITGLSYDSLGHDSKDVKSEQLTLNAGAIAVAYGSSQAPKRPAKTR